MEYDDYWRRYSEAKEQAFHLASTMVLEALPAVHMALITFPGQERSTDLGYDERVFDRDDTFRRSGPTHPHDEKEMVDYFWRDGFVPRWIDCSVFSTNGSTTVLEFYASDVFTRYEADGCPFYTERRLKPWASKSPPMPLDWQSAAQSGRFSLNWHLNRRRPG